MIKDKDLKPCTICGGKAKTYRRTVMILSGQKWYCYGIKCDGCNIDRCGYHTRKYPRSWWNERV